MTRIGIMSDIHAGLPEKDVHELQREAVLRGVRYLINQKLDRLLLNGDTTDHLGNVLAATTSKELAQRTLDPLNTFINLRRDQMRATCLGGNTDWPAAEPDAGRREVFYEYTGFDPDEVDHGACGGLLEILDAEDRCYLFTHGHALSPAQWGHEGAMTTGDYEDLLQRMGMPDSHFLDAISAVGGAHRKTFQTAQAVGRVVRPMPSFLRRPISGLIGRLHNAPYRRHFAGVLAALRSLHRKPVVGVMGHTHVARVDVIDGMTIINTGTAGAKPNPLQRLSDPTAHVAVIDTEKQTYELVRTYHAARPNAKTVTVARGEF